MFEAPAKPGSLGNSFHLLSSQKFNNYQLDKPKNCLRYQNVALLLHFLWVEEKKIVPILVLRKKTIIVDWVLVDFYFFMLKNVSFSSESLLRLWP